MALRSIVIDHSKNGHVTMQDISSWIRNHLIYISEIYGDDSRNAGVFPTGGRIGHIHLKVMNLKRSIKFYHEKLGLHLTSDWSSIGAAFLSVGGYHHHIGINTWHCLWGEGHRDGEAGLKNFTITSSDITSFNTIKSNILYDSTSQEQMKERTKNNQFLVQDPDGMQIVIRPGIRLHHIG